MKLTKEDTTKIIIAPPRILPNRRKDIETAFESSPIKFNGAKKKRGSA